MTGPDARARDNRGRVPAGERKVGPASAGPTEERIVVRDKRKINPANQAKANGTNAAKGAGPASPPVDASAQAVEGEIVGAGSATTMPGDAGSSENVGLVGDATPSTGDKGATSSAGDKDGVKSDSVDEAVPVAADSGDAEVIADAMGNDTAGVLGAELEALRRDIDELTRDLQRVSAEYANYRKRVDRDRGVVTEQATGAVLAALLPVLDDLDRAREHGDLVGPFGSVAEQLIQTLSKFGLTPIGEKGDPFDPTRHEAVAHQTSTEVTEPTCVDVLRRGYVLGERLLRPALVAVAEPE